MEVLSAISGFVWGPFLLVPLLLLTGLYLTIVLRGLQFRILGPALHLALIKRKEDTEEGDISHYQALMTALAATIGTGNIVGVATAIAAGGPGALFWMWVTALVGMATKYSEGYLGVKYRVIDAAGERLGGPMEYLTQGVGGAFGRTLGLLFAIFASVAAFGIGNMVQSNAVSNAMNTTFGVPTWITGVVLVVGAGAVILGGIKSIGRFAGTFVPLMAVLYMLGATVVLVINFADIPAAIALVFTDAFTGTAAVGGFAGAGVMAAIRFGVARGIFSNESGLGTGGIAAAAAQTRVPARQAMVSMTQTFIDTIIVVSFTGLVIITTGLWKEGLNGSALTTAAFSKGMPGNWGGIIVAVGLSLFAFSTLLGWAYYGERNIDFLFGRRAVIPYRVAFIVAIFVGTVFALEPLWLLADILNGLMALPNLIGLLLLSGIVARESLAYYYGDRGEE